MLRNLIRIAGFGAMVVLLGVGSAFAGNYHVDSHYSTFEVQNDVRPVKGSFEQFEGNIVYEPVRVEDSSVEFCLKTNSFKVKNDDVTMLGGLFFDLANHPEIHFKSSKVENAGDRLMVTGTLSMLGVSREVMVPVKILGRGNHPETGMPMAGFAVDMKIKLSEMGVDQWVNAAGILGDTLNIRLKMVGVTDETQHAKVKTQQPSKL